MTVEIEVSSARCIGSKACIHAADGVFRLVDGVSRVVDTEAAPLDDVVAAAEGCPTGAIKVKKDGRPL